MDDYAGDNARNPLDTFPCSFPVEGEVANLLPTCCGMRICYSDTANYLDLSSSFAMLLTSRNKLATSLLCRCNGISETTRHKFTQ